MLWWKRNPLRFFGRIIVTCPVLWWTS
jgi:hypothetical protein